ncbi:MAG TPA: RNA methyltransferase [Myxococcales bacterium]|nr:RNA methyltransferase [Myxococcales bacterium]
MLRTAKDALQILRRERVLTLTPAGRPRSLVGEIAGEVRGSWWAHPEGGLIFAIAGELEDSPEVLAAKLVDGKVSFVHRTLWPQLVRVVLDPGWRREAAARLPAPARQLLAAVERAGKLRPQGRAPARRELEKRALVLATQEHTDSGRHTVLLRSWEDWPPAALRKEARALELDQALGELRSAGLTL